MTSQAPVRFNVYLPGATKRRPAVAAVGRAILLVAMTSGFAVALGRATSPEGGIRPVVIVAPGEDGGAAASRLYRRPPRAGPAATMVRNAGGMRAYEVEEGIVSWYGFDHIGRKTATGAMFNPEALTAAHKSLPFGAIVRVTRLDTGADVLVTIDDRGPYVDGRIIDLAKRPADLLGLRVDGIAPCRVEVLAYPMKDAPRATQVD
jgi:rare lipoprotein A